MEDISKQNYFEIFGLEPSLKPNPELTAKYMKLQLLYHPDKFMNANDNEKLIAMSNSSLINKAYEILKSNIKRVEYFLLLVKNIDLNSDNLIISKNYKDIILAELDKREELENCNDLGLIIQMINNNNLLINNLYTQLYEIGENLDSNELSLIILRLKYIHKFLEEAEKRKFSVNS